MSSVDVYHNCLCTLVEGENPKTKSEIYHWETIIVIAILHGDLSRNDDLNVYDIETISWCTTNSKQGWL